MQSEAHGASTPADDIREHAAEHTLAANPLVGVAPLLVNLLRFFDERRLNSGDAAGAVLFRRAPKLVEAPLESLDGPE